MATTPRSILSALLEYVSGNFLTLIIFVAVFYLTWTLLTRKKQRLPPGPRGVPIFGYLPFLDKEGGISSIAMKYGRLIHSDIICLDVGLMKLVLLNTYDMIKEVFQKRDDCVDRPEANFFRKFLPGHEGLVFSSGSLWKEHRRFSLSVLRDFGMGKVTAEDIMREELDYILNRMEATGATPINPRAMITEAVSNIICSLIFGHRYDYDNEEFRHHIECVNNLTTASGRATSSVLLRPWMRYLPECMDIYGFHTLEKNFTSVIHFAEARIAEHKANFDPDDVKDYIDAYLLRMQEGKESFTDFQLGCEIFDLFFAGSETTSTTLRWAMYFMAKHPEIQAKVQNEIDSQIGGERLPTMKDRLLLPYTEAVLMEVQRMATILQTGVFHSNLSKDITIGDYVIPKGTFVGANILAVHRDPQIWPDPENFNTSNFYKDGKFKNQDRLIPFEIGRRSCIGEALAKMELFLFFASWLQRFTIVSTNREELDAEPIGLIKQPAPFHVQFQKRKEN